MATAFIRFLLLLTIVGLTGCGGGGGGGMAGSQPATVGVLLTDATTPQWDQAIATVTSVRLIGDSGQVDLFSGSATVDLLKLGDFSELFAVSDQVPPGTYSKIRLQLSNLVLNRLDPVTGDVIETETPQLVGNGKIDLNPRDSFVVGPGAVIFVELDIDMEKSLKITETGNGKLIVRPVVFVDIRTDRPGDRLSRIHGEITHTDPVAGSLRLCQTAFASHSGDDDQDDSLRDENHCLTVRTDTATGIFDGDGLPENFSDLDVGEEATAVGRLRRLDDENEALMADDLFALDAVIIEEGPLGTYSRFLGTAASGVDPLTDQFAFDIAPGQGLGSDTTLPVQLFERSRIFTREGEERSRADIVTGRDALVDGVLQIQNPDPDLLRSPLVILRVAAPAGETTLEGAIVSVNSAGESLIVSTEGGDRCVNAAHADVFLVNDDDGFSSTRIGLADLLPGQDVAIFGHEGIDGCVIAETILADDDD